MASTYVAAREFSGVLPCAAVLAARACVPGRIVSLRRGWVVFAAAALAAVLPLATAAAGPAAETHRDARLTAWLTAHRLRYGLAWFSEAATFTVLSDEKVQVRAVQAPGQLHQFGVAYWEEKPDWYRPSLHRATFIIVSDHRQIARIYLARIKRTFGHPAAIYHIAGWVIACYRQNLLTRVATIPQVVRQVIRGRPAVG